ncbi:MAG: indole-3-glycerol phosphate synthase TrpC [Acidobacteria bacterium]|nr:indole-3-glycerol phosphate synthase TrpC [Acidobacteriota bacterium]
MATALPDILARIVRAKQDDLERRRHLLPEWERAAAALAGSHRGFFQALAARMPAIIAEIKKASPSKGILAHDFDPRRTARQYHQGGASAVSVLTDEPFFQGSLADLTAVRSEIALPVLRKDFTLDEYHVVEAAAHGADAILLIAAILDEGALRRLRELAESLGLAALVEVHDEEELGPAVASGARLIGVNNRNLRTFEVTLETSLRLAEKMPAGTIAVSESGIHTRADVDVLMAAGYRAFLVGEHLMKAGDPAGALRVLAA